MKNFWLAGFFIFVSLLLFYLSQNPLWQYHLRVDVDGQYYSAIKTFKEFGHLGNLGYNEYLPGAILFFLSLSPFSLNLVTAIILANLFLIGITAFIYKKWVSPKSALAFLVLVLAFGPILLFRFELFVGLMVLISVLLFLKNRHDLSFFLLGLATITKIYPAIVLPIYLLILVKKKQFKIATISLWYYFLAIISILTLFFWGLGANISGFIQALTIHSIKPVHVESTWGTVVTIFNLVFDHNNAIGKGNWGIYGISPKYILLPLWFFNYFWIFPVAIYYLKLIRQKFLPRPFDIAGVILVFLAFSKILTAQYLFWYVSLVPLFIKSRFYMLLICAVLILSQIVYPLSYNELLGCFYSGGACYFSFSLLTIRNLILISLALWLLFF
jgi:hypothetical protein